MLGYARQRERRDLLLSRGARSLGVKIGANDPASQRRLRLASPIAGYLTDATLVPVGQPIPIGDAVLAGVEPEFALTLSAAVPHTAQLEEVALAIGNVGLAAEIIDVNQRYDDLSELLAGNIFHRAVLLPTAPAVFSEQDVGSSWMTAHRNGDRVWSLPIGFVLGDPREAVLFAARAAWLHGDELRPGETVMSGLLTPLPIWVKPGDRVTLDAGALGRLELNFTSGA